MRSPLFIVALACSGCFYAGGGARTTFDARSWERTYSAHGYFGASVLSGQDGDSFGAVDEHQGFGFSLAMGAGYNDRLGRWEGIVGPRFAWLFPHGIAEFSFETSIAGSAPQTFSFLWSVGPRIEVSRSYKDVRTAHVISVPAAFGFTVGDGFRPQLAAGLDYHLHAWRPGARFD